jgi:YegS/Rv2252/BmrU family lipid kinase
MSNRYLAIVNPAAGGGRCGKHAPEAVRELRRAGIDVVVEETRAQGDATRIAREGYRSGIRHFIGVGGDGTGYEIVNGLFPDALAKNERPSLGFLPLGTGNSFLRDFTSEGDAYSRRAICEGKLRPCDVVRLRCKEGDVYYINILSLGFVADVCTVTNRRFKPLGEAGYGLGVVVTVAGLKCKPIPMALDEGQVSRAPYAFVSMNNSRFTGGKMMMAPDADPSDGLVDVITVGELGRMSLIRTFPKIFDGSHLRHPAVSATKAKSIVFDLPGPVDAMIDGEVISLWPERLDVLHHALDVRV